MSRAVYLLAVVLGSAACGTTANEQTAGGEAGQLQLPDHFGFGRPASVPEIAALDIDIMPDGSGLPLGRATAKDGAPIYQAQCAGCHGAAGEGTPAGMPLVGRVPDDSFPFANSPELEGKKTIGNYWPYATTIFDYVRRAMPFDHPGSLNNREVYALTAWLLWKNGIIPEGAEMDAQSLPAVRMPARDRFVRDDREASTRVR